MLKPKNSKDEMYHHINQTDSDAKRFKLALKHRNAIHRLGKKLEKDGTAHDQNDPTSKKYDEYSTALAEIMLIDLLLAYDIPKGVIENIIKGSGHHTALHVATLYLQYYADHREK